MKHFKCKIVKFYCLKLPYLNKLKSEIKNCAEVTLNLSSDLIGNSNDEINSSYKLLFRKKIERSVRLLQIVHQLL